MIQSGPSRFPFLLLLLVALLGGCTQYEPFDSVGELREEYAERTDVAEAEDLHVPFELDDEIRAYLDERLKPAPREEFRVEQVNDFIFRKIGLEYSLYPTRNAVETYQSRQGNCLSFVNLFVGVARHQRLNPFYVEVNDFQRWRHQDGMILSQGHIVAGMYVNGELRTYDFLPYRPKSYKEFNPIDDITAAAHYYNNLAAEALIDDDIETTERNLKLALDLKPTFEKALNNLGVLRARQGDQAAALAAYRKGLESDDRNVPILSNLARLYQQMGDLEQAEEAMAKIEGAQTTNPFYFIYRGQLALGRGEADEALQYMRRAFRIDTEIPEVHVGLAEAYLALGDIPKARHHVERALKLDATHRDARRLAALIADRGDRADSGGV